MTRFVSGDCWYIVWMTWTNKYIVWICERCHICPRRNKNVVTEETRFFSKLFCDTMRRERCVENVDVHPSLPQTLRSMGLLSGDSLIPFLKVFCTKNQVVERSEGGRGTNTCARLHNSQSRCARTT